MQQQQTERPPMETRAVARVGVVEAPRSTACERIAAARELEERAEELGRLYFTDGAGVGPDCLNCGNAPHRHDPDGVCPQ